LHTIQFQAQQKEISLQIDNYHTLPKVLADQEKTSWVLINLLTNAIKYSSEKGAYSSWMFNQCFSFRNLYSRLWQRY
jgi:signal transduction histidine kinase